MGKEGESLGRMVSNLLPQAPGEDKLRKSEFNIAVNVKPGECLLPEIFRFHFGTKHFIRK
jgi:hypothetical protein